MMKKILLLTLLLCSSSLYAQDYYVCDTGSDSNAGTSAATPYKSFNKALELLSMIKGGDNVLMCRGGTFQANNNGRISNNNCSQATPCTISDYGNPTDKRPTIIANGVTVFNFEDGGNADKDGGYIISNLILKNTSYSGIGIRMYNDVDDVVMDNLHIEGFDLGVYSAGANTPSSGANKINENISLTNSTLLSNSGGGWLGGCNDCKIENNHFENNGFKRAVFNHNLYFYNPWKTSPANNVLIRGNTLYKSTMVNGSCSGVSLVAHGKIDNLTIENNYIYEDAGTAGFGCWGIAIDTGYSSEEAFRNLVIKNNRIEELGGLAIGCSSCVDVIVEGNTVVDTGGTLREGVKIPNRAEDSLKSANITVTNNNIALTNRTGAECVKVPSTIVTLESANTCDIGGTTVVTPPVTPPPVVPPVVDTCDTDWSYGTSKAQILGLVQQLTNLLNADTDTAKASRSVADLYGKKDEVLIELGVIKEIVEGR